jgi:hypothetical protein
MALTDLSGWLVSILIFAVQATMVYGFCRLLYIGGGIQLPNPFQKGWSTLHAAYASSGPTPPLQSVSARVGMVNYGSGMALGLGEDALFLRRSLLGEQTVRIPYAAVTLVRAPGRNTVLRIPVRTDGLFEVQGVRILLRWGVAETLVARLAPPEPGRP